MRSPHHGTSVPASPLDNAFSPAYLNYLREQDEVLTAAEAELAGPWKIEPVPGKPGAVAVLREWEDQAAGDRPVAILWHEERARLLSVLLPALDREPLMRKGRPPTATPWPPCTASRARRSPAGSTARSRAGRRGSTSLETILRSPFGAFVFFRLPNLGLVTPSWVSP